MVLRKDNESDKSLVNSCYYSHSVHTHTKVCVHSIHLYINTHHNLSAVFKDIGSGETEVGFEMPTLKHKGATSHIHFIAKYMITYLTINITFMFCLCCICVFVVC